MDTEEVDDGGPAFPIDGDALCEIRKRGLGSEGMSLLDYFAGQALSGLLAGWQGPLASQDERDTAALRAYQVARRMMAVRARLENIP